MEHCANFTILTNSKACLEIKTVNTELAFKFLKRSQSGFEGMTA